MKIDHSHQPVNREDFEHDYQSADKNPKIIENSIQSYSKGIARHLVSTQQVGSTTKKGEFVGAGVNSDEESRQDDVVTNGYVGGGTTKNQNYEQEESSESGTPQHSN